jgi:hypothetical protein
MMEIQIYTWGFGVFVVVVVVVVVVAADDDVNNNIFDGR